MTAVQDIQKIKVKDLCLWTENPRDPIDTDATDTDIIKHAIDENPKAWNLDKLVAEMGAHYDLSELPTVVYIDDKPVVYDGNRRVAVLKYLQNPQLYSEVSGRLPLGYESQELKDLTEIPCNVCNRETALINIERKHSSNGSWGILQRDYFLSTHRGQKKSFFQEIEEQTGLISQHPKMNQRFVKEELLTPKKLEEIGFSRTKDGLIANYTDDKSKMIFDEIVSAVNDGSIDTRTSRGKLKNALLKRNPNLQKELEGFDKNKSTNIVHITPDAPKERVRKTPISRSVDIAFGRTLSLKDGPVNDLYRGIDMIYASNHKDEKRLACVLPIVGMSMRLILDVAARKYYEENGSTKIARDQLYKEFLKEAKQNMSQENKNFVSLTTGWLSDKENMDGLLAKYAHGNITAQKNDILNASIIVGDILEVYFKKEKMK